MSNYDYLRKYRYCSARNALEAHPMSEALLKDPTIATALMQIQVAEEAIAYRANKLEDEHG